MKEHRAVVSRRGQITIPIEIRQALDLREGDAVVIVLDDHRLRVARSGSVVARTAGALKSDAPALTAEEERAAAEQVIAEDVVERMNG